VGAAASAAALLGALAASATWAQWAGGAAPGDAEFHFVRLAYSDGGGGYRRERWLTDWPEAEQHLLEGVRRLTRVDAAAGGSTLAILDEDLFEYPWLYAVEVGSWSLSDDEATRLREYLLRGGFLMVDDFHGSREWEGFASSMRRVFPDRPIVEVPEREALFHLVYDAEERVQIPGIGPLSSGFTYERDGVTPHWRGIYDDQGRLMVVICFNMDLGDAWEHADTPGYPLQFTKLAYEYAINYIVYAMSH
jgi:hypothetical protein